MYAIVDLLDKLTDKKLFACLGLSLLIVSCQKRPDMASYYFPLENLNEGLVYHFESQTDPPLADENWFYQSFSKDSIRYLRAEAFDHRGEVAQLVIEKETVLGILTDSLLLYANDSIGRVHAIPADIRNKAVYPYYLNPEENLEYEIQWTDIRDGLEYTLSRRRKYSKDTMVTFRGQSLRAVKFEIDESLETFWQHDGMTNSQWKSQEVFAEGLGLVYYKKTISPTLVKEYLLTDTMSLAAYKERY